MHTFNEEQRKNSVSLAKIILLVIFYDKNPYTDNIYIYNIVSGRGKK